MGLVNPTNLDSLNSTFIIREQEIAPQFYPFGNFTFTRASCVPEMIEVYNVATDEPHPQLDISHNKTDGNNVVFVKDEANYFKNFDYKFRIRITKGPYIEFWATLNQS